MGLRAPVEVAPTFLVWPSNVAAADFPRAGVEFRGSRVDLKVDDIVAAEGRRTPDWTVAQRRYRFAFVLVTSSGGTATSKEIAQLETYRKEF